MSECPYCQRLLRAIAQDDKSFERLEERLQDLERLAQALAGLLLQEPGVPPRVKVEAVKLLQEKEVEL